MTYRKLAALAAVGAIALMLTTNDTVARAGAVGGARVGVAPMRSVPNAAHAFRNHNRFNGGFFWPGYGDAYGAYPLAGEPITSPLAGPNEVRYTTIQDVPWDWVHRFPPMVAPSDRPYVPGCGAETVDVGGGKTVNVFRCY